EKRGRYGQQGQHIQNLPRQPAIINVFGWLGAHQTQVVAPLRYEEIVRVGILSEQDTHCLPIRHKADDVSFAKVVELVGQND
ncbi:hypothetical protein, partial [Mesorhizobium sp. LNJC403B00]|uniref:hypothetical protein n=1 Tax=Mesorhizobium sp. LNJC403B00 TaxID=1287280 RepID=UPI000518EB5D